MSENYLKQACDLAQAHRVGTEKVLSELHQVLGKCLKFDQLSDKTKVEQAMQDENSKLIEMNNRICDLYIKYCLEAFGINIGNCQNNELSFENMETSSLAQNFNLKDSSNRVSYQEKNHANKCCP